MRNVILAAMLAATACSDPTRPVREAADTTLVLVAGAAQTDTINSVLKDTVVVQVLVNGAPLSGQSVRFELVTPGNSMPIRFPPPAVFTARQVDVVTNAAGQARVALETTSTAGTVIVRASLTNGSARDSATLTVLPGNPVAIVPLYNPVEVLEGETVHFAIHARDRNYNIVPMPAATITGGGGTVAVIGDSIRGLRGGIVTLSAATVFGTVQFKVNVIPNIVVATARVTVPNTFVIARTNGSVIAELPWGFGADWNARGDTIVMARNGQLLFADMLGAQTVVPLPVGVNPVSPRMSHTGRVYFTQANNAHIIWSVAGDGSGLRTEVVDSTAMLSHPDPNPAGTKLAYTRQDQSQRYEIIVRDLVTGTSSTLVSGAGARWSPDGASIAYVDSLAVRTITQSGSHGKVVFGTSIIGEWFNGYDWTPDSRMVVIGLSGSTFGGRTGRWWFVDNDTGEKFHVYHDPNLPSFSIRPK